MEDNFYQTSTERLYATPKVRQEKLQKAKQDFERERPLITAVMERLENAVSSYEKVSAIKTTDNPEQFMREVEINKQVCAILGRELEFIKIKVRMYDNKELR